MVTLNQEEMINAARERAWANHKTGLNCAESVFKAILDSGLTDLPPEVISLATAFGGGGGLAGNNCGALNGALLAVSSCHGRKNPLEKETFDERKLQLSGPQGLYRLFNNVPRQFKEKFGAVNCSQLVAPYEWGSKDRGRFCQELIGEAAAVAMFWILQGRESGYALPYGPNVAGIKE